MSSEAVSDLARRVKASILPVKLSTAWIEQCLEELIVEGKDPLAADLQQTVKMVYGVAMHNDIRSWAESKCIPACALNGERGFIEGPILLQVDETVNVGASADKRFDDTRSRLLKLCLCDGFDLAFAVE